jgi:hypothetical protein
MMFSLRCNARDASEEIHSLCSAGAEAVSRLMDRRGSLIQTQPFNSHGCYKPVPKP